MAVYKIDTGYQVRFAFDGKQYKKNAKTKREALAWEASTRAKLERGESLTPKNDKRRLTDLVEQWYTLHGHSLKTGRKRVKELTTVINEFGNPLAAKFKASDFANWRLARLESGSSENTVNHYHTYLSAVFAELIRVDEWQLGNPLTNLKKLKMAPPDTTYLTPDEVNRLLKACESSKNKQLLATVKLCLATGARWGEAAGLHWQDVDPDRVTYTDTKNGTNRTVPIDLEMYQELKRRGNQSGFVFNSTDNYRAFTSALLRAGIELPAWQKTHVLRHTFASHFVMNGGDLLTLQKILGHSSLDMVLKYAHLAPDHLDKALKLNPLKTISPFSRPQPNFWPIVAQEINTPQNDESPTAKGM